MEGIKVLENSYSTLLKLIDAIKNNPEMDVLSINFKNFDCETCGMLKEAIRDSISEFVPDVKYSKIICGDICTLDFKNVLGIDDREDILKNIKYVASCRSSVLCTTIMASSGK